MLESKDMGYQKYKTTKNCEIYNYIGAIDEVIWTRFIVKNPHFLFFIFSDKTMEFYRDTIPDRIMDKEEIKDICRGVRKEEIRLKKLSLI